MSRTTYLHSGWEFIQTCLEDKQIGVSRIEWLPASVPGHIHLDLVDNGVIAHPFERMNELGCQWVDQEAWSYRTTFELQPDASLPKRVLRFEGLDTICTVTVNGQKLAESDNMFVPVEIDVSDVLKAGTNEVRIDFRSAVKLGLERQDRYFEEEELDTEKVGRFGDRAFVRKAQYMYGWDWGPRLVSCGIWKPVKLIEYAARLTDVHVAYEALGDERYKATIASEVDGDAVALHVMLDWMGEPFLSMDGEFELEGLIGYSPYNPAASRMELVTLLVPKETAEAINITKAALAVEEVLDVDDEDEEYEPSLWEVLRNGLGAISSADEAEQLLSALLGDAVATTVYDLRKTRCDYHDIVLVREPDQYGESFMFTVNGEEFYARGANWIPDHSFPSVITREQYRKQLERCLDLNINMLRVWGGGYYESDDFYELCDEMGILVWQDFPFACGFYPDNREWTEIVRNEASINVKRLRNHPSLAVWCGNNENQQCYAQRWAGDKTPERFYGEHIYNEIVPSVLAKFDPTRSYTPGSAVGPKDDPLEHVNDGGYGDAHYWDVWHGRGDWRFYSDSTARFSSEFGFVSSCALSTWDKYIDEEDWDAWSPVVRWHDKTGKGYANYVGMVELHYPKAASLEDWTYYSQLNQRDALRFGIEHFRRSEFCKGTLVWQINDCWPVQSWAFIDCEGQYKALAYELRRLYADLMVSIARKEETVQVWLVNDGSDESGTTEVVLSAYSTVDGSLLKTWQADASVDAHRRTNALEASVAGLNVNETLLVAEAGGVSTWQLLGEPKNVRFAPPASILVSTAVDGALHIRVDGPVVDLQLTEDGATEPFGDNYLTLPQGGDVLIPLNRNPVSLEARSMAGEHKIRITRSPI